MMVSYPWRNCYSWIQTMAPYPSTEEVLQTNELVLLWHIGCGIGCDGGWGLRACLTKRGGHTLTVAEAKIAVGTNSEDIK